MTARPAFELAEVFRRHGEGYERANAGHLGRVERRVIGAITACRTAALSGHVEQCDDCGAVRVSSLAAAAAEQQAACSTVGAIANAVWHATGVRVRRFPIRVEDVAVAR